jgi:hypothetical protein
LVYSCQHSTISCLVPRLQTLHIYLWPYSPLLDLGRFFSFLVIYTLGRTPWTGDQPVARPLPTHRTTQTQNKRTQTSMPRVGFEPTIPVFERTKTVHALDRAATVIGRPQTLPAGNSVVLIGIKLILSIVIYTTGCNEI